MKLWKMILDFFRRVFCEEEDMGENKEEQIKQEESVPVFSIRNEIFELLKQLEQEIYCFRTSFPKEYQEYSEKIRNLKENYKRESEEYQKAIAEGLLHLNGDPEEETSWRVHVYDLKSEIQDFIAHEVAYDNDYKMISELCFKLLFFYNTLLKANATVNEVIRQKIQSQFIHAVTTLKEYIDEVKEHQFFNRDTRKKESILNACLYVEYLLFKIGVFGKIFKNFEEKEQFEKKYVSISIRDRYENTFYLSKIRSFFIEDFIHMQLFLEKNLKENGFFDTMYQKCDQLQKKLDPFEETVKEEEYFLKILKLESTIQKLAKVQNQTFKLNLSSTIEVKIKEESVYMGVNKMAIMLFGQIPNKRAKLLQETVESFQLEIDYRDLYFLCKTFDLTEEIINVAKETFLEQLVRQFERFENQYTYPKEKILAKNKKIQEKKNRKYQYFCKVDPIAIDPLKKELDDLYLDYKLNANELYINALYFHNLENIKKNLNHETIEDYN